MSENLQILNKVLCYKKRKDVKGVITSCKLRNKQYRQHNDLQNTTQKT